MTKTELLIWLTGIATRMIAAAIGLALTGLLGWICRKLSITPPTPEEIQGVAAQVAGWVIVGVVTLWSLWRSRKLLTTQPPKEEGKA